MPTNFDVVVVVVVAVISVVVFVFVFVFVTVLPHHRVAKMTHPSLHGSPVFAKTRDFFFFIYFPIENIFFFQANKPVVVTLGATLHQIQKVDAKEGTLTTMVW